MVATGPDLRGEIVALVDDMTDMLGFVPSLRLGRQVPDPVVLSWLDSQVSGGGHDRGHCAELRTA